ncbi:heme peroxidase [Mycolicibacter heraklionensis]|nr:heme peroxidase [Mycolicibacter heraklionensis]
MSATEPDVESQDVAVLGAACARDLGDPVRWFAPDGYPNSLALSIVDSIYSTGALYSSVENVVARYRSFRRETGADPNADGTDELAATFAQLGVEGWADSIGNRRPTSSAKGAPLKAEAILLAVEALSGLGVRSAADLRALSSDRERAQQVESAWRAVPGQGSGITWAYLLMLAHVPGVKADRMVVRYVARALGSGERGVSASKAADLVTGVARERDWDVLQLDHAIWRFESGRPFQT